MKERVMTWEGSLSSMEREGAITSKESYPMKAVLPMENSVEKEKSSV